MLPVRQTAGWEIVELGRLRRFHEQYDAAPSLPAGTLAGSSLAGFPNPLEAGHRRRTGRAPRITWGARTVPGHLHRCRSEVDHVALDAVHRFLERLAEGRVGVDVP